MPIGVTILGRAFESGTPCGLNEQGREILVGVAASYSLGDN
jgi:hypothetical protein